MTPDLPPLPAQIQPSEETIREYAYQLYQQSNCAPGRDEDNWFEAAAHLQAQMPPVPGEPRLIVEATGAATYEAHALGDWAGRLAHGELIAQSPETW